MTSRSMGECCLRWTDHQTLLQGVCNSLLTSEKFADVTLYCEDGHKLQCHKFMLSACSSYFDDILSHSPACDHPVIILRDVPYWQMEALLHFIYKGELNTDENKLKTLVELAQSLHIKGIGDFGTVNNSSNKEDSHNKLASSTQTVKHTKKTNNHHLQSDQEKCKKNMRDYLSIAESNMNSISDRLMNLPPESQQLLGESLSGTIDASDYNLQETEVEYSFEPESMEDNQPVERPAIFVEYAEEANSNSNSCSRRKRRTESEADMSSDASLTTMAISPVYKRYSEQHLLAAIKAVLDEGVKQADACAKFGIPFTTLTRKIRLYTACGGRLPLVTPKRRELSHRSQNVSMATVLPDDNELDGSVTDTPVVPDDGVVVVLQDSMDASVTVESKRIKAVPTYKQYKAYTEENLREAIAAVLNGGMRLADASHHFGIPLTTLTRKIRSSKETVQQRDRTRPTSPPPLFGTHQSP